MGAAGQRLGLRLFLEGIEVPVISANVQIGVNSPAVASIQVVPGDSILALKPRTMVHLFFWDYSEDLAIIEPPRDPYQVAEERGITIEEATKIVSEDREASHAEVDDLLGYKILYSGEVIGVSVGKSPVGRSAVLQCSDFSTYWDTTYQFMISYGPNGNFLGSSAAVWAGGSSMFDDILSGHTQVLTDYIGKTPKTPGLKEVKGLMGGIISLLEAMGGVPKHTHGVNDFFTVGELRNHILQQIVCEQNDNTSARLLKNKTFEAWLSKGLSSLGTLSTFRDMMKLLFKYIYYEVVPNPAAMYVPAVTGTSHPAGNPRTVSIQVLPTQIETMEKVYKDVHWASKFGETVGAILPYDTWDWARKQRSYLDQLIPNLPWPVRSIVQQARNTIHKIAIADNAAPDAKSQKDWYAAQRKLWTSASNQLLNAINKSDKKTAQVRDPARRTGVELDRLQTQIFRPDCFFAAPPRCNVLFPDQYTQFQFSRNFLQEVTRLRLHIGWQFGLNEGLLETEFYFAPTTKEIRAKAKEQGSRSYRALLEWEKYSGILPKFETVHEVNYVAQKSERNKVKGTKAAINNKNIQGHAKNYGQRIANFNYMKYRFAARSCSVSTKFNPFMVCGFPAAIIERPFTIDLANDRDRTKLTAVLEKVNEGRERQIKIDDASDHIRDIAREFGAPSQYLGMVTSLSHNITQEGGNSSASLSHARTHRITDDDFMDIFSKELTIETNVETVRTDLDVEKVLASGDIKLLKLLMDVTDQHMGEKLEALEDAERILREGVGEDSPDIIDRPDNTPALADSLGGFAPILTMAPPTRDYTIASDLSLIDSPENRVRLRGELRESDKAGVYEPATPGQGLARRKKGAKGGKIVRVQCHSDSAVMVEGIDVNRDSRTWNTVVTTRGTLDRFTTGTVAGAVAAGLGGAPAALGIASATTLPDTTGTISPVAIAAASGVGGAPAALGISAATAHASTKVRSRTKPFDDNKKIFLWRSVSIYEEVPTDKKRIAKTIPVEEALRPAWFSPLYSNWFIGDQIYMPFFGTGSVVDQALFQVTDVGGTRTNATFGTGRAQQEDMLAKLQAVGNDRVAIQKILEDAKADYISDVPDVESSLDALAYVYGEVRRMGLDVHRFVNDYTKRPIATMKDIFGSADLEYKLEGDKLVLVKGTPGFHSSSIDAGASDHGQLAGLLDNPDLEIDRIKAKGKKSPVDRNMDPRPGRRRQVKAYLEEINAGSGSLGIGVSG